MGENPNANWTTTFPWLSQGVQATDHQTCAPGDQKQTRAVGNHELKVETDLPERPQTFAEGLRRRSSSSTDVSRAGVEIPPPALFPPAHPPSETYFEQSKGENTIYSLLFRKDPIAKYADARRFRESHAEEILMIGRTVQKLPMDLTTR